jgi:hypothetical protein
MGIVGCNLKIAAMLVILSLSSCKDKRQKPKERESWETTDLTKPFTLIFLNDKDQRSLVQFARAEANGTFYIIFGHGKKGGLTEGLTDCDYLQLPQHLHRDSVDIQETVAVSEGSYSYAVFLPGTATVGKINLGFKKPK